MPNKPASRKVTSSRAATAASKTLRNPKAVRKWLAAPIALSLGGALLLSACGGGSGSDSATGVSAVSVPTFCNDANATDATLNSRLSNNIAPLGKSELTSLAAQLRTLAGEAPAQIKADLTTMGAFYDKASINGVDTVDSATTSAANAAGARVSAWVDQNCGSGSNSGSGNGNAGTSAPTSVTTRSLTAFCADRGAVTGDAAGVVYSQSDIPVSDFEQYVTAAEHLAAEAPPTPSNLAQDAGAVASDLSAKLQSPNDANAAPNLLQDMEALSADSLDCP